MHICTFLAMNVHLYMHLSLCFHICSGLYKFSCMYSIFVYMGLCIFSFVSVCYYLYVFLSLCLFTCVSMCVHISVYIWIVLIIHCLTECVHYHLCMSTGNTLHFCAWRWFFFHLYASCVYVCKYICVLNMSLYMCVCITTSIWALEFPYLYAHACANVFVSMNMYVH